jgi:membrane protease YdiL (CAAX protease family)
MLDDADQPDLVPPLLPDRTEARRLFWAIRLVAGFFGMQLKAGLIIGFFAGIWAAIHGVDAAHLKYATTHPSTPMYVISALVEFLVLLVALFASMGFRPRPVGLRWAGAERSLLLLSPLVALMVALILVEPGASFGGAVSSPLLGSAVLFAGLVGMTEELVFRGILMGLLGGSRAPMLAVFGSATLFAVAHLPSSHSMYKVWFIFGLFGVPFALVYLRTGSILGLAIVHAAWDAVLMASAGTGSASAAVQPTIGVVGWVLPGVVAAGYLTWYGIGEGWVQVLRELPERFERSDVDWDALAEDDVLNPWITAQLQQAASSM